MRFIRVASVAAALALALLPAPAVATPAPNVTFTGTVALGTSIPHQGMPGSSTSTGAWTATGAISGSLSVSETIFIAGNNSHEVSTATNANGTLTIDAQSKFLSFTPTSANLQGSWVITAGTGAYAHLCGNGDFTATVDRTVHPHMSTETLTGVAAYCATR